MNINMTTAQRYALGRLCWGLEHFSGFFTGQRVRKSTVMTLVRSGLAEDAGLLVVCDGDGFAKEPERERFAFRPTEMGIHVALLLGEIDVSTAAALVSKLQDARKQRST